MKTLIACMLGALCGVARADAPPEEFWKAFGQHQQAGTLLDYETPREFEARGWGPLYRDAVATKFQGGPHGKLHLEISTRKGYEPKVGVEIALEFRLHNRSDKQIEVTTNGSCGVVHQAAFLVIDPRGRLWPNLGRIRAGGFHLCEQNAEPLSAHATVKLKTRTDSTAVVGFAPKAPGRYVVIGMYHLSEKQEEPRVLSAPLAMEIRGK